MIFRINKFRASEFLRSIYKSYKQFIPIPGGDLLDVHFGNKVIQSLTDFKLIRIDINPNNPRSSSLSTSYRDCKTHSPQPQIATFDPLSTYAVLRAAPYPIEIPHSSEHTFCRGAFSSTLQRDISAPTVYSAKVEHPIK
jgi:hypothetical protein